MTQHSWKRILISLMLCLLSLPVFAQMNIPRVYVQKLVLSDGSLPQITQAEKKSAEEYLLRAWFEEMPEDVVSTQTHPIQTLAIKEVGKEGVMPQTAIANVQLGNFKHLWKPGDTLHLIITHKETGESRGWSLVIPEGSHLIKHLDEALVIPPRVNEDVRKN